MKGQPERSRRHASAPEPREGNYCVVAGRGSEAARGRGPFLFEMGGTQGKPDGG